MKGRTLALFLLMYLALDLANPFMPGAVTFVDGRIEVIDAGRPADLDLPIQGSARAADPSHRAPAPARPSWRPAPAGERLRRWQVPASRVGAIAPEPALSSDDH
jgi:hypothetical protein